MPSRVPVLHSRRHLTSRIANRVNLTSHIARRPCCTRDKANRMNLTGALKPRTGQACVTLPPHAPAQIVVHQLIPVTGSALALVVTVFVPNVVVPSVFLIVNVVPLMALSCACCTNP